MKKISNFSTNEDFISIIIKIIILILVFGIITLMAILLLMKINDDNTSISSYKDYSNLIMENSSWKDFSENDFNSLVVKAYSTNVLSIIESLEKAIPVIIEVQGGQFSLTKNNFIIASSFNSSNKVVIYLKNGNSYIKKNISIESLLENATRFFILDSSCLEVH